MLNIIKTVNCTLCIFHHNKEKKLIHPFKALFKGHLLHETFLLLYPTPCPTRPDVLFSHDLFHQFELAKTFCSFYFPFHRNSKRDKKWDNHSFIHSTGTTKHLRRAGCDIKHSNGINTIRESTMTRDRLPGRARG